MQAPITLASGSTTDPFLVNPDGWVLIEAGSSTVTLQYTTGTTTDIAAGTAAWVTAGSYTGFTAVRADEELADTWVKLTASGGSATYHVEGELSKADRLTVRGYKKSGINNFGATYSTDSSGNVTGLVGPGGNTITLKQGRKAVLLGDSIAANNWVVSGSQNTYDPRGVFIHANVQLGWCWDIVGNGGATGERSDQILLRVPALLSTYSPDWVLIPGGFINDIAADISSATIISNLQQILNLVAGRNVVWVTALPSTLYLTTATRKTTFHTVNQWLKSQQGTYKGLIVIDGYSAFVDTATGGNVSTFSGDSLHPNTLGASNVSRAIVRAMQQIYGLQPSPVFATGVDDYKNLCVNPYGIGSNAAGTGGFVAGSLTGTGPNGWEGAIHATGAGVGSQVATSDEVQGQWNRVACTNTALGDGAGWIFRFNSTTTWAVTTAYQLGNRRIPTVANGYVYKVVVAGTSGGTQPTWPTTVGATVTDGTVTWACFDAPVVGDTIYGAVEFSTSSWSAGAMVGAYIECLDGVSATVFRSGCLFAQSGDALPTNVLSSGVLYIPPIVIPATTVNVNLRVRSWGAAGSTGNFDVRRVLAKITNR